MIFEQELIIFEILDVFAVKQKQVTLYNSGRGFDAISFRIEADTIIETKHARTTLTGNSITYFPAKVNYTRTAKVDDLIVIHFNAFNYHADGIEHFSPPEPQVYAALFRALLACWQKKDTGYKHEASALLCQIFAACYRDNKPEPSTNSKIERSIRYIEENYLDPDFSLTRAAERSYMSDVYFRKLFRAQFNLSPKQYVIRKRIKHAAALINSGYYPLKEIARMCGYPDYKYFSVEFKRIMGISPSQYGYTFPPQKEEDQP